MVRLSAPNLDDPTHLAILPPVEPDGCYRRTSRAACLARGLVAWWILLACAGLAYGVAMADVPRWVR